MVFRVIAIPRGVRARWLPMLGALMTRRFDNTKIVSVAFVSRREMQRLNSLYRGKNKPTDVLSFNIEETHARSRNAPLPWPSVSRSGRGARDRQQAMLGEIVLCSPILREQARQKKHSIDREFQILTIHGVLHLLGYDHEILTEARVMERLESKLLGQLQKNLGKVG